MTTPVRYRIDPPILKWMVTMETKRISVLSSETIRFPVYADSAGLPVNPTSLVGEAAFVNGKGAPTTWIAGAWDTTVIGTYVLQIAASAAALAVGTYYVWVQIQDPAGTVIRQVGQLVVV